MLQIMATALSLVLTAASVQGAIGLVPPTATQKTPLTPLAGWSQRSISTYTPHDIVVAQAGEPSSAQVWYTKADGYTAGRLAAESRGTIGSFGGGVMCGLLTSPVGAGILWAATRGDEVPAYLVASSQGKGADYSKGFVNGYSERTQQKKRGARLGGGLLGSVGFLVLYLVATH